MRVPDEEASRAVLRHSEQLREELNVKSVVVLPRDAKFVTYRIKPNLPVVGKRYGNLIQPPYFPVFGLEQVEGKNVVILWCPGGQNRPYRAPEDVTAKEKKYQHYIRRYSNSVVAKDADLHDLMTLTAKVPFDDRLRHEAALMRHEAHAFGPHDLRSFA